MNETTRPIDVADRSVDHRHGPFSHLLARWPSVAGLLALVLNAAGGLDSHVTAFIIIVASTCYLAAAALGSRPSGWVMVGVVSVAVVVSRLAGMDPTVTLLAMGLAFSAFGFLRPGTVDRREVATMTVAFIVFSSVGLAAMMSGPVAAVLLAAAAAIGHGILDVVYFLRDKVVLRSLAEACFVLDLGLAGVLLATAFVAGAL